MRIFNSLTAGGLALAMLAAGQAQESGAGGRFAELPAAVREDSTTEASRIVGELANEDPLLAIEALRRIKRLRREYVEKKGDLDLLKDSASRSSSYLDRVLFYSYSHIDSPKTRLVILGKLVNERDLANELEFSFRHFAVENGLSERSKEEALPEAVQRSETVENKQVAGFADFCGAAPEDLPLVLLLPGVASHFESMFDLNHFRKEMAARFPEFEPKPRQEMIDAARDAVPARFHELIEVGWKLKSGEAETETEAAVQLIEMVERADLPVTVRIGLVSETVPFEFGNRTSEFPEPLGLQLANWLAEAWEVHAVTGIDDEILREFLFGKRGEAWSAAARRLLAGWNQRVNRIEETTPAEGNLYLLGPIGYLVCLAAEMDDADSLGRLTEMLQRVGDPLTAFALLVRSGEHQAAWNLVAKQRARVFFGDRLANVPFEPVLEAQVEPFLEKIGNPELRYLIELHLKIPEDSRRIPLNSDREERIVAMAKRFDPAEFVTMEAKYTVLRLLAKVPEAAAVIADEYVAFANLDRVREHHRNRGGAWNPKFFRTNWSELAADMVTALLSAGDYQQAVDVLERIAEGTAPIDPNDIFRQHEETWELVTEAVLKHLTPRDATPLPTGKMDDFLPILRFMVFLPEAFYDEDDQYLRGQILTRDLRFHRGLNREKEWWAWRHALNPEFRANLDLQFLKSLRLAPFDPGGDPAIEEKLLQPYLFIIEEFEQTVFGDPIEKRLGAIKPRLKQLETMTPDGESLAPRAIRVLRDYGYFSDEELRRHVLELAKVMGYPDEAWWDLRMSGVSEDELFAVGMSPLNLTGD